MAEIFGGKDNFPVYFVCVCAVCKVNMAEIFKGKNK